MYKKKSNPTRIGYVTEEEFAKSCEWYSVTKGHLFYHKLPDTHAWTVCINTLRKFMIYLPEHIKWKAVKLADNFSKFMLPKQPGDFLLIIQGIGGICEVKSTRTQDRVYIQEMISPHQISYANSIELYGKGFYYYILVNRIERLRHYMIPLTRKELQTILREENRRMTMGDCRGFSWEELYSYSHIGVIVSRRKEAIDGIIQSKWDVSPIIEDILKRYGKGQEGVSSQSSSGGEGLPSPNGINEPVDSLGAPLVNPPK